MVKKKAPRVNHYLEYAIVSAFFNILFGMVAIVLSGTAFSSLSSLSLLITLLLSAAMLLEYNVT